MGFILYWPAGLTSSAAIGHCSWRWPSSSALKQTRKDRKFLLELPLHPSSKSWVCNMLRDFLIISVAFTHSIPLRHLRVTLKQHVF